MPASATRRCRSTSTARSSSACLAGDQRDLDDHRGHRPRVAILVAWRLGAFRGEDRRPVDGRGLSRRPKPRAAGLSRTWRGRPCRDDWRAVGPGKAHGPDRVAVVERLGRRNVVSLADGPAAGEPVAGVAVDGHQVERVDARLLVREPSGRPAARAGPAVLELADVPVLAVGEVPERDRVGRIEVLRRDRLGLEQPLADDPGVIRRRPARADGRAGSPGGSTGTSTATGGSSRSAARRAR